jgi:YaaC-like Protein
MTFWDMARRDRGDSWRRIRSLRSRPPSRVNADRRSTYAAALEQAEQQFDAAAQVATESRAINLFYGLSQAGRAIACAYADVGEPFELRFHGITNENLDDVTAESFPSLTAKKCSGPNSSFRRLSELMGSAALDVPVEIGALWAMLVEPNINAERLTPDAVPTLLVTASREQPDRPCIVSIPLELVSDGLDQDALAELYPALGPASGWRECGNGPTPAGIEEVHYEVTFPNGARDLTTYRGDPVILPAVPGTSSEMHPTMIWWAILYSLSMLTRYRPETWTELVNVDAPGYAVPVQFILEVGLDAVPDLIAHALDDAPTQ